MVLVMVVAVVVFVVIVVAAGVGAGAVALAVWVVIVLVVVVGRQWQWQLMLAANSQVFSRRLVRSVIAVASSTGSSSGIPAEAHHLGPHVRVGVVERLLVRVLDHLRLREEACQRLVQLG